MHSLFYALPEVLIRRYLIFLSVCFGQKHCVQMFVPFLWHPSDRLQYINYTSYTIPGDKQMYRLLFSFFLPEIISNLLMILMVPFGQAISQAEQPVQACSFFSSCSSTTSPRKRSAKFSVSRLSGYCSVMISL